MPDVIISGGSDDIVDFEGAIHDEFYAPHGVWEAWIESAEDNKVRIKASFCQSNPDGWDIEITDSVHASIPWQYSKESVSKNEHEVDYYIVLTVPEGTKVNPIG